MRRATKYRSSSTGDSVEKIVLACITAAAVRPRVSRSTRPLLDRRPEPLSATPAHGILRSSTRRDVWLRQIASAHHHPHATFAGQPESFRHRPCRQDVGLLVCRYELEAVDRRDRQLFVAALAKAPLTSFGATGEREHRMLLFTNAFGEVIREHRAIHSALGTLGGDGSDSRSHASIEDYGNQPRIEADVAPHELDNHLRRHLEPSDREAAEGHALRRDEHVERKISSVA